MEANGGTRGDIALTVRCDKTKWGDLVAVVGEGQALGNWNPDVVSSRSGPLLMLCNGVAGVANDSEGFQSITDAMWPQWVLAKPLTVTLGERLEYKYIIIRSNGKFKWETQRLGENRQLIIDEAVLHAGLHDDGEFGCIPCAFSTETPERKTSTNHELKVSSACAAQHIDDETCVWQGRRIPAHRRLRQIGKGKQGRCFLIEIDEGEELCRTAVLKEFKGGGRHAFQAEVWALSQLSTIEDLTWSVPRFLGADKVHRQVLISYFNGTCLPDASKFAAVLRSGLYLKSALLAFTQILDALEFAHRSGIIHCDVNPWNVLINCASSIENAGEPSSISACLVDWACAKQPSEPCAIGGHGRNRRGDFQPPELGTGVVGERTDVYGSAATLLWILVKRTRKGLEDKSKEALAAYFVAEADQGDFEVGSPCELSIQSLCEELAIACSWGLEEDSASRCPHICVLRERVMRLLSRFGNPCMKT